MSTEFPTPHVGQIVHYTNLGDKDGKYPPETQAAIITSVADWNAKATVALKIFYKTGIFDMPEVRSGIPGQRGTWCTIEGSLHR